MRSLRALILTGVLVAATAAVAFSHCQVPCGIYTDEMRFGMIEEDCQTIEKAMKQIEELSAAAKPNYNQIVRWVTTKEEHAAKIQEIVNAYFLTQRVKPADASDEAAWADYVESLRLCHAMLVQAMKCKQTTDPANVAALREAAAAYKAHYFKDKEHDHE